ncbi:unnamed protein product [Aspergillus oryzae]|uniref:Unnamed protein product n=2 Tax=Aspergillus oryzae TaxID=5062 RepID=A0AAN4YIC1_ASPOZ|nr:unnamed protein product [Aspergillus oryzae]GMF87164.1 unnamed protein product [Aspergillus oryzae]GMG22224.1 unnamed protein product [Aspergillus oryzae]GMG30551.1 unnamed protein product [Aspergillus oryzae]
MEFETEIVVSMKNRPTKRQLTTNHIDKPMDCSLDRHYNPPQGLTGHRIIPIGATDQNLRRPLFEPLERGVGQHKRQHIRNHLGRVHVRPCGAKSALESFLALVTEVNPN